MGFFELLLGTFVLRPYVFIFLLVFLAAGILSMGLWRTLVFMLITWVLAFLSEFASTRTGFPYGWYDYTQATRGQELFIANVPFMDSLSYTFLLFASFTMSLWSLAPLRIDGWRIWIVACSSLRTSGRVLLLTVLYLVMIDVVIDPTALQGERWFLGHLYNYREVGYHFGVPLSNAFGWALVGWLALGLYQQCEKRWLNRDFQDRGLRPWPWVSMLGAGLYYGVLLFILAVTVWLQEWSLLIADVFIFVLPTGLLLARSIDPRNRASEAEWQAYLQDFYGKGR